MADRIESVRPPWWHGRRGEWFVVVQFGILALVAFGPRTSPWLPAWPTGVAQVMSWLGPALMIAGAPLAIAGLLSLGSALTALPYPTDDGSLVVAGPYAIVRHPIYSGLILGALGWALYQHSWLVLGYAVALFVLFDAKSRREETWLMERYEEYAVYRSRVAKLIPWLY